MIDSLHAIASHSLKDPAFNLPAFLSSFVIPDPRHPKHQISLVAVYHMDVPCHAQSSKYAPSPLVYLSYLATSVIYVHSVAHLLAQKYARDRSIAAPVFGLTEELEGVVIGLSNKSQEFRDGKDGLVIELEHRRKSGRSVVEWLFLPSMREKSTQSNKWREQLMLLDDHPLFRLQIDTPKGSVEELSTMTFDLSLTERQKQDREGVVLPYFDAQQTGGLGEGGRIYMGA